MSNPTVVDVNPNMFNNLKTNTVLDEYLDRMVTKPSKSSNTDKEWCDRILDRKFEEMKKDPSFRLNILREEFGRMLEDPNTLYQDILKAMDSLGKSSFDIGKHRLVLFSNDSN